MDRDLPAPVFRTAITARAGEAGDVIEVHLPDGARLFLDTASAADSAQQMAEAVRALNFRHPDLVRRLPDRGKAHPIRMWVQSLRLCWIEGRKSTRMIVAAMLLPVTWGIVAVPAFLAVVHFGLGWGLAATAFFALVLAPMLAWRVAPALMSGKELRPPPRKFQPRLVH